MQLEEFLASRPRVPLGTLPTPLDACPRLSEAIGGAPIAIKRDDLSGFALGGNKVRMLEFALGEAVAVGADCLLTGADVQSNQCRAVAAGAARLGMECHLVVSRGPHPEMQGNLLLQHVFGAHVRVVEPPAIGDKTLVDVQGVLDEVEAALRATGKRPFRITGQRIEHALKGMVGYMTGAVELAAQLRALPAAPSAMVICAGSGTTMAGLVCGLKALGGGVLRQRVIGVTISNPAAAVRERILALSHMAAETYGLDCVLEPDEVDVRDGFVGPGYGLPSEEGLAALALVARTEGILLDPIYTSKTAAALFHLIRSGELPPDRPVVMVHTGGIPGVFAYHQEVAAALPPVA
ncbi:MAG TPA: D-cysteine desulfhydrase family protein [Chloroflexota bacterium]|nr:D-cysteine desulfhydrase family protein [Chloroflexota bacterium]